MHPCDLRNLGVTKKNPSVRPSVHHLMQGHQHGWPWREKKKLTLAATCCTKLQATTAKQQLTDPLKYKSRIILCLKVTRAKPSRTKPRCVLLNDNHIVQWLPYILCEPWLSVWPVTHDVTHTVYENSIEFDPGNSGSFRNTLNRVSQ